MLGAIIFTAALLIVAGTLTLLFVRLYRKELDGEPFFSDNQVKKQPKEK